MTDEIAQLDSTAKKTYPRPTQPLPTMDELEEWVFDSVCEATDGCDIEPDGICEHGYPSWLLWLGLV